jgi:hypothetical protein
MSANERLVRLFLSRSDRLTIAPDVDRHAVLQLDGVPARPGPARASRPTTPWDAMLGQLSRFGTIDGSPDGDRVLEVLLASEVTTPDDLRSMLRQSGLSAAQRRLVLKHPQVPGDLVVAELCDDRHDRSTFTPEDLRDQLQMVQQIAGVTGEQRLTAWSTVTLRCAISPLTEACVGDVLIAAPRADVVLHAAVERSIARTRRVPLVLGRHLLSHLVAPATVARISLRELLTVLDHAEREGARTDRLENTVCDLVVATCGVDPARWATFFALTDHPERSLGDLLDEVEASDPDRSSDDALRRSRRDVLAYQRHHGSSLLKPIEPVLVRR